MTIKKNVEPRTSFYPVLSATPVLLRVAFFCLLLAWLLWLYWALSHGPQGLGGDGLGVMVLLLMLTHLLKKGRQWVRRQDFIRAYRPEPHHWHRIEAELGPVSAVHKRLLEQGWRDYCLMQLRLQPARRDSLWMPSKAVDALWHALLLDSRHYQGFCQQAFGSMLHHVPDGAGNALNPEAQRMRAWQRACRLTGLDPRRSTELPLLWRVDAQLGVQGAVIHDPQQWSQAFDRWIASARRHADSGWDSSDGGDGSCGGDSGCGGGCGGD